MREVAYGSGDFTVREASLRVSLSGSLTVRADAGDVDHELAGSGGLGRWVS
jgi:hypothetical protein